LPEKGLTINMWLVAGLAAIGTLFEAIVSFSRADARLSGFPAIVAPVLSAWYSLDLDTAIWMIMCAQVYIIVQVHARVG